MTDLKVQQNTVFIVLYNSADNKYTISKIMSSLEKAYTYVSEQEKNMYYYENKECEMIEVEKQGDISDYKGTASTSDAKMMGVCYIKKGYMKYNICFDNISDFIIIPKTIE